MCTEGTYYIGVCVESVTDESNTGNNCSAGVQITVSDIPVAVSMPYDFSGNGYNDLVWHNYLTGDIKLWSMEKTIRLEEIQMLSGSNTNLVIKAFADFNNDGSPDIVVHNSNSGMVRIWLMDGMTRVSNELVLSSSNTNLHIIGAGDFTGDGNVDIAVHNSDTGALRIWMMDGDLNRIANISAIDSSNTNLQGVGVGDLNADGYPDVLLHNSATGNVRAWLMNGTTKISNALVANSSNTNLKVRGVMDIDADGKDDILWQNRSTGKVLMWKMNGIVKNGSNIDLGTVTDLTWDVGIGRGGEFPLPVALGSTTDAYLEVGVYDFYKVTVNTYGTLNVKTLSDLDTYGYLMDSSLAVIAQADDINYPDNANFKIEHYVSPGTYYIYVMGYDSSVTGNYSLRVWMD